MRSVVRVHLSPYIFFLMRTSKAKFEFRKIAHLIEQSEMMVLPKYFLAKTSEAKSEVRKQAHLAKRSNGVTLIILNENERSEVRI